MPIQKVVWPSYFIRERARDCHMWSRNSESSLDIRLISYVLSWFLGVFFWTTCGVSLNFCWKVEVGYPMITNCFYKFTCGHIAFSRSSRVSYIPNVRMYTCHQNDFFISKKRGRAVRALPKLVFAIFQQISLPSIQPADRHMYLCTAHPSLLFVDVGSACVSRCWRQISWRTQPMW